MGSTIGATTSAGSVGSVSIRLSWLRIVLGGAITEVGEEMEVDLAGVAAIDAL